MTYDALDRLITTEDPFGLTLTYTYDADGNRIETQDSLGGVTTYVYDADNELISEQFGGTGQIPLRIDMTYDGRGELSTETRYSDLAGTQVGRHVILHLQRRRRDHEPRGPTAAAPPWPTSPTLTTSPTG